ncbi:hypothetical protein NAC44_10890 [Allorhizobium sp. BGMRC 0089]|uniref:hypothetical protein n=1 Tax=Allorhizobium sonneratiae TaxID=2934936 RepID=UPI002033D11B|nr:hypothetical protein [Allorhizobium sonneratiae]MCM2292828.1 hypothetical protein [Allorhizobium sonneratiae]
MQATRRCIQMKKPVFPALSHKLPSFARQLSTFEITEIPKETNFFQKRSWQIDEA